MPTLKPQPSTPDVYDRVAHEIFDYLASDEGLRALGNRHVRAAQKLIGIVLLGLRRLKAPPTLNNARQLKFIHNGQRYKVRYNHLAMTGTFRKGGIEILEIFGRVDGPVITTMCTLRDAERFFLDCRAGRWP